MLISVLGPIEEKSAGVMLPHEHILVGFVEDGKLTPQDYDREDVVETILPNLIKLREVGCESFVDCSPEYLGRDPWLLKELSQRSGLHIITNTGFYKEPYLPPFVREASEEELANIWIHEAKQGIGDSGVFPGYIKIALNDGRINELQQKILRAAIKTSLETGLVIQSHTIGGETALHAAEIMQKADFDLERFIWVHAQTESDLSIHEQLAGKGMWISIDSVGRKPHEELCIMLKGLVDRGLEDRIILSQDTGWYNVGQAMGGQVNPYHLLFTDFIPYALHWGLAKSVLDKFNAGNAYRAMRVRI